MTASLGKSVAADYYLKKARAAATAGYYSSADNAEPDLYVWNPTSRARSMPTGSRVSAATIEKKTKGGKTKIVEHPSADRFRLLCTGLDPDDGTPLGKSLENEKQVLTYDLTFSCDKDISNLAMAAKAACDEKTHETIIQAVIEANAESLEWLAGKAFYSRQRDGAAQIVRVPCKPIVISALQHDARPVGGSVGAPHVHVQNVLTGKGEMASGKWGALDAQLLYRWKHAAGAHFRAVLREKLEQRLGLVFAPHPTSGMIVLAGMDPVVREVTSPRTKRQIEQGLPEEFASYDKATRAKIREAATIATRKGKDYDADRPRLDVWKEMYAELGFDHAEFLKKNRAMPRQLRDAVVDDVRNMGALDPVDIAHRALAGKLYDRERDDSFAPTANFTNEAFLTDAEAARCVGDAFAELGIAGKEIGPALDTLVKQGAALARLDPKVSRQRPRVVDAEKQEVEWIEREAPGKGLGYTSPEQVAREKELLEIVTRLHADDSRRLSQADVRARLRALQEAGGKSPDGSWRTREEQLDGIEYLACDGGRIRALEGTAGSGKSWSVIEATKLYPGARVISTAIAWERTSELHREGVERAGWEDGDGMALAALIARYEREKSGEKSKTPLAIDKNTIIVCDEAGQVDVKTMLALVRIADETGCRIFLTGDRMQAKAIAAGDGLDLVTRVTGFKRLDQSVRMKLQKDIAIATLLSGAEGAQALDLMDKNGQLKIDATADAVTTRAVDDAFRYVAAEPEKTAVVLARKNSDVKAIIDKVRARLIEQGELGEEEIIFAARTRYGASEIAMRTGEEIRFGERYRDLGVKNGTFGTIENIARGRKEDSARLTVFLHAEDRRIEFDTADFAKKNKPMKLSYGGSRKIGVKTIYDSQGATVDWAGHVLPGGAIGTGLSLAFVAHSRARFGTTLYLNEAGLKKELREAGEIGKSIGKLDVTREDLLGHVAKKFSAESRKVNALDTHVADPRELAKLYEKPTHAAPRPTAEDLAQPRPDDEFVKAKKPTRRQLERAAKKAEAEERRRVRAERAAEKERLKAERAAARERERAEREERRRQRQAEIEARKAERARIREEKEREWLAKKAERETKKLAKQRQADLELLAVSELFDEMLRVIKDLPTAGAKLKYLAIAAKVHDDPDVANRAAAVVLEAVKNPAQAGVQKEDLVEISEIVNSKKTRDELIEIGSRLFDDDQDLSQQGPRI